MSPRSDDVSDGSMLRGSHVGDVLSVYRRRLPHWRLSGSTYFVTWRLHGSQSELAPDERSVAVSAIQYFDRQRYEVFAYVVMDDHVHVLVRPHGAHRLQDIVHTWKSYTARRLQREYGRQGAVWQDEYLDRIVRDDAELVQKGEYILNNPFNRWPDIVEYRWVGVQRR